MQNLYVPGTIVFTDRVCLYLENVQLNSLPMTLINKSYFSLKKKSFQFKCNPLYSTLS